MKSFTTFLSAAVGLGATFVNAAALSNPVSVLSASSVAINATATSSGIASTSIPIIPTPTGGFTIAGVYTTCLAVTFNAATTTATLSPSASGSFTLESSLPAGTTTPVVTSFTGSEVIIPTGSVTVSVSTLPTGTITQTPDVAVFTTCLVFLPTPSVTGTIVPPPIGSLSATATATESIESIGSATATLAA